MFSEIPLLTTIKWKQGGGILTGGNSNSDPDKDSKPKGKGLKAILSELGELWDQSQYADEYNIDNFLDKLNNG